MLDFSNSKILIVGDVMLDKYYFGKVDRISPEAPVPIVNIQKKNPGWEVLRMSPTTLSVWGGHSLLCGVIGHDLFGKEIERISRHKNIDTFLLKTSSPTITKARIIGGKQQIVRVDYEDKSGLNADNKSYSGTRSAGFYRIRYLGDLRLRQGLDIRRFMPLSD